MNNSGIIVIGTCTSNVHSCIAFRYSKLELTIVCFTTFTTNTHTLSPSFSPSLSDLLYVAGSDRSLHVYDMNQMKWVWSVSDAHKRPVHSIVQNKVTSWVEPVTMVHLHSNKEYVAKSHFFKLSKLLSIYNYDIKINNIIACLIGFYYSYSDSVT